MNPVRSGGEISYAVLEVIYDDWKVRQSAVHKCHAQLPCKCLARYQARPCLALRTALVHGKIPRPICAKTRPIRYLDHLRFPSFGESQASMINIGKTAIKIYSFSGGIRPGVGLQGGIRATSRLQ